MEPTSSISNLADLKEGEIVLPVFMSQQSGGLFVSLPKLATELGFERFVERVFAGGSRFFKLDYDIFLKLLYDPDSLLASPSAPRPAEIRLAADIVPFQPERRVLYKGVKIVGGGERAEFIFAPVAMEMPVAVANDGETPLDCAPKMEMQSTRLDFDEFVADMWQKGIKYGIDAKAVRQAMERGETVRLDVARQLEPTLGTDATIKEETPALHRNDTPKIREDGKADLSHFKNRFPQIGNNVRLLKKIPRVLGKLGRKVTGMPIEPPIPKDFDLNELAGPGTRVEYHEDGEVIVSTLEGFINLDKSSNQVTVTEKIESREGVSLRTTGDLCLDVDEFVEHGEVQEGRVVEGKHMSFRSAVFGTVISEGGHIQIDNNLSGGLAKNMAGSITVSRLATRAALEAWNGEVSIKLAEGSTIIGKKVKIERAVNCEIIGEEVDLGISEGCAIAGKFIKIGTARAHKDNQTTVTILVPEFSHFDQPIASLLQSLAEGRAALDAKSEAIRQIQADVEFTKYLSLAGKIRQGAIKLAPEQENNWLKIADKFAPALKQLSKVNEEKRLKLEKIQADEQELARLSQQRMAAGVGTSCAIAEILGETVVQTQPASAGILAFHGLSRNQIKTSLRNYAVSGEQLFSGERGQFQWEIKLPEAAASS
ncbi:MAG: flagellar assembly protein A [Burkholderiales bacterium]